MKHARDDYNNRIVDLAGKIPGNEPVFLIRGQDIFGADTVRFWADRVESNGGEQGLVLLARKHAILMDAWPRKKSPDAPARGKAEPSNFPPAGVVVRVFLDPKAGGEPIECWYAMSQSTYKWSMFDRDGEIVKLAADSVWQFIQGGKALNRFYEDV